MEHPVQILGTPLARPNSLKNLHETVVKDENVQQKSIEQNLNIKLPYSIGSNSMLNSNNYQSNIFKQIRIK